MYTAAFLSLLALARAQKVGTDTAESHPSLSWQKCTSSGCSNVNGQVVIDANWRWTHNVDGFDNCYDGNDWTDVCSSNADCAENCALEGSKYQETYGVSTSGNALTLKFVNQHQYGTNVGSRMYLMESESMYQMFTLKNNELAFDVDLSTVECGINSALYFVAMEADGGSSSYPVNEAGAKYGTGYCDAQCARDLKFIGGQGNFDGWEPSDNDPNAGVGGLGACCAEMDVWESNSHSFALTPHPCTDNNYHVCEDTNCGGTYSDDRYAGKCDPDGCDYNPYRMGNKDFYGAGKTLDTSKKFTVVTQFQENKLTQFFVQGDKKIEIPAPSIDGVDASTSNITPELCAVTGPLFDSESFSDKGGWSSVNEQLSIPMVLVMSIWDDHYANMLWLDSTYPIEDAGKPGAERGDCPTSSGVPAEVEKEQANAQVIWSNIRFGPIGSTTSV